MHQIHLNGEPRQVRAATILALVEELSLDPRKVAVERNLEIVPKSLHAATPAEWLRQAVSLWTGQHLKIKL